MRVITAIAVSLLIAFTSVTPTGAAQAPPGPTATAVPPGSPGATPSPAATPTPVPAALSEADVAARVGPSVVQIVTERGGGSGVKIQQGVVTSAHVVGSLDRVEVVRSDGVRSPAVVSRADFGFDLALLSLDLDLPPLDMEPARLQRQGETVLVFGYPLGHVLGGQATLTRGLLSAVREPEEGLVLVQTDAAMNPGSSGGAIVNMRGKLIGVSAFGMGINGGLNFGVATESVQALLAGVPGIRPDAYEPDDEVAQARILEANGLPRHHSFHVPGDNDWAYIQLAAGDRLVVFTISQDCDTYLYLYEPDGGSMVAENDDYGWNLSSWIDYVAPEDGTYYVRVRHFSARGTCRSYGLATTVTAGDPESEAEVERPLSLRPGESRAVRERGGAAFMAPPL